MSLFSQLEFRYAVHQIADMPPDQGAEVAFAGRSNAGKSTAINALANPGDRKAQELAAFEREASDAVAAKMGRAAQGFFVPVEVQQRDLLVGTATAGGHTVATQVLAANFIELLRNKLAVAGLGAQFLSGLVGNIAIPRQTAGATAYCSLIGRARTRATNSSSSAPVACSRMSGPVRIVRVAVKLRSRAQ